MLLCVSLGLFEDSSENHLRLLGHLLDDHLRLFEVLRTFSEKPQKISRRGPEHYQKSPRRYIKKTQRCFTDFLRLY